jgi:hypothetical protein
MALHWVEQAAIEAQAELAAEATAAPALLQAPPPPPRTTSQAARRAEPSHAEMTWPTCERAWSHSDELDQLCGGKAPAQCILTGLWMPKGCVYLTYL